MAPVPVKKLTCDGDSYKCTADLVSGLPVLDGWFLQLILTLSVVQVYGDGRWVAEWDVSVFHA
jgi:hypothetical protein